MMADIQEETLTLDAASPSFWEKEWDKGNSPLVGRDSDFGSSDRDAIDSMILVSGPKLVRSGVRLTDCHQDDFVMLLNSGGETLDKISADSFFEGGEIMKTNEPISDSGDFISLYQSARYGNFFYKLEGLPPGNYMVDFHFAEIIYSIGPKGMRTFDIFVQDEKIVAGLDIYAIVGANKALQLVDIRASVVNNGELLINFKGVSGSPIVSGIAVRKATPLSENGIKPDNLVCSKCSSEMDVSPTQNKIRGKLIDKYEKRIQELIKECASKSEECFASWSSVADANEKLQKIELEIYNSNFKNDNLEQNIRRLNEELGEINKECQRINEKYQRDKKLWAEGLSELERKIKAMKEEQAKLSKEAHGCVDSIPDLNEMTGAVQSLVAQCEDLKYKYSEEMARSKRLFNAVQETKGNIRVFCRCRPLNKEEIQSGFKSSTDFDAARDGEIGILNNSNNGPASKKTFRFDRVFSPKDDQCDVYAEASPLVTSVLDGYNVCIFAYGQTGTGKTFTMEGTERNRGVNYRTVEELFKIAENRKETVSYEISVSVLEVYNETIRDLLDPSPKKLEIRQTGEGAHHVPGLVEAKVGSIEQVWDVLRMGSNSRAVGSNNVNEHSSRSHCMLSVMVRARNLMNGVLTKSKLWLVDLAGSERLAKTDAQGERLKEAQNINKSLSALGDVISALANKNSHIPYRNSKLTHLLQDSLGGDSKALMFVQISPSENDLGETLSSLNFASRVRGVELGPAKKQVDNSELQKYKQMLEKSKQEVRVKEETIRKLEENCHNLESKLKGNNKYLQEKLESQKMETQVVLEKQQRQLKEKEEICSNLNQKVKELELKVRQHQGHSDSENSLLHQKVKEMEYKVKEYEQNRSIAEEKIEELERKLLESKQSEARIRGLEILVQELRHKPNIKDEVMNEAESHILCPSNHVSKPLETPFTMGKESILLCRVESLQEIKRKRGDGRISVPVENENINNYGLKKMSLPIETNKNVSKVRRIDPVKGLGRLTRSSKVGTGTGTGVGTGTTQRVVQREGREKVARGWVR